MSRIKATIRIDVVGTPGQLRRLIDELRQLPSVYASETDPWILELLPLSKSKHGAASASSVARAIQRVPSHTVQEAARLVYGKTIPRGKDGAQSMAYNRFLDVLKEARALLAQRNGWGWKARRDGREKRWTHRP